MRTLLSMALCALPATAAGAPPAERIEDAWDLSELYPSIDAWDADVVRTEAALALLDACRGALATRLQPCLSMASDLEKAVARQYTYAGNHANGDTRDAEWQARAGRVEMLFTRLQVATAFVEPELLALGEPAIEAALQADPELAPWDYFLRSTLQDGDHTLDAEREALLASASSTLATPEHTRSQLVYAELPWPTVTLADGTEARLDSSAYSQYRGSPVRSDRALVFEQFFSALHDFEGTLGAAMNGAVQGHWMNARAHGYETSVAAAIDRDHIPPAVYETLIRETNHNLPTLHRYLALRARMLGVDDLAYSDLYPQLVAGERSWTIDQAKALTIEATRALGPAYTTAITAGLGARWMDVYPRPGKRGGAYMDGDAYDFHPFVLMNYVGDYESVSTLAHEWGHAMHSLLSRRAQPYPKAGYSTFIAEIASTFNEALLLDTMLRRAEDDDERLFYLGMALESLRTVYFRQAQLAEFEVAMHTHVEQGEPLTGAWLSATYLDILERYYGADAGVTRIDELYGVEWAYIPHFYYNFYVYQYATSIAASSLLAEDVLHKKKGAVDRYLALLEAGGSDAPYLLLKKAGVDMATPEPYRATARRMDWIMDEMEKLLAKKARKDNRKRR